MQKLYYFHDPMCSWCWGFVPVWQQVRDHLSSDIALEYIVGGLAPDNDEPMSAEMQFKLQQTWQRIQDSIPGTTFNFEFWSQCQPRRSTYPACRAVLATKNLTPEKEQAMICAIQHAYYCQARNPSDVEVLVQCAVDIGLEKESFTTEFQSKQVEQQLLENIAIYREYSSAGFPSLVLKTETTQRPIRIDYNDASLILSQLNVN